MVRTLFILMAFLGWLGKAGAQQQLADSSIVLQSRSQQASAFGQVLVRSGDRLYVADDRNDNGEAANRDYGAIFVFDAARRQLVSLQRIVGQPLVPGRRLGLTMAHNGSLLAASSASGAIHIFDAEGLQVEMFDAGIGSGIVAFTEDQLIVRDNGDAGSLSRVGRLLVYERRSGSFQLVQLLLPSVPLTDNGFGSHVKVAGNDMVVTQGVNSSAHIAHFYHYKRSVGGWSLHGELQRPAGVSELDLIFMDLAFEGGTLFISAPQRRYQSVWAHGELFEYQLVNGAFELVASLPTPIGSEYAYLGSKLSMSADRLFALSKFSNGGAYEQRLQMYKRTNSLWSHAASYRLPALFTSRDGNVSAMAVGNGEVSLGSWGLKILPETSPITREGALVRLNLDHVMVDGFDQPAGPQVPTGDVRAD